MVMDIDFVNVGADDKSVFVLGKTLSKFQAKPVGLSMVIPTGQKD